MKESELIGWDDLLKLLAEWRDMPAEPTPGEGLVSTEEVSREHEAWVRAYDDLARRTDKALGR